MNTTSFSQSWVDTTLYPFENKYLPLDAGKGETILFVHGTPAWSFLYREFVQDLSQDYRCIAIDHLRMWKFCSGRKNKRVYQSNS